MNEFWSKTPCEDAGARQLGRVVAQETHESAAHGDTLDQIQVHQHQSSSDQRASGVCGRHSMSPCQRTGSAPSAEQDVVSEECLVVAPAGWCVLRQMHIDKYLFNCVLIHASNIKMSLSRVCRLSRRCVDREGKKTTLVVVGKGENTTLLSVEVPSILQLAGPRPQGAYTLLTLVRQSLAVEDPV